MPATKKTSTSTSKAKTTGRTKTSTKLKSTKTKTTTSTTKTKTTKSQTKIKSSSTAVKSSSHRAKKPGGPTTPKTKTTSSTRRKTTNTPVKPTVNTISFTNERISKGLTYSASYNGGNNIDFSMTLHDNEGKLVTGSMSIARIKEILKPNYNIGIIGFSCGIYTFEFDRREFEQFLANNGI